jgi:threonine dehydrogenase-like Zn-dependent dehydrogenase
VWNGRDPIPKERRFGLGNGEGNHREDAKGCYFFVPGGTTMKAITVEPGKPGTARLEDVPEPDPREGSVLVEAVAVGVCGTDVEIVEGKYGWPPAGTTRLVLGHESLGRVLDPGPSSGLEKGDLVVGIVRRPDPVPCPNCAVGEWDMCRNGRYTERGIKQIHGYMSERWRIEPEYAMKVDRTLGILGVLLEPTTVIAKALEQVQAVGHRAFWQPRTVLVTGAGPIGLLAAFGAKLMGTEVHVLDRVETGVKPELVRALGATYHAGSVMDLPFEPDVIVECTGVGAVIADAVQKIGAGGVVCLTGVGAGGVVSRSVADIAAAAVLKNNVVVGSVNANKRHWYRASQALARADRGWLGRLITRREKPENFQQALARKPDDIKVVIQFSEI